MAIKERKQITGTEAQIKGYAGHNGVLAYATDTKHLHVLSGAAGTTTKLANMSDIPAPVDISGKADKTYVDTELTKKQPKGDYATNTALTDGLAGKANTKHAHSITDVTDLQDKLDGKLDATAKAVSATVADTANSVDWHNVKSRPSIPSSPNSYVTQAGSSGSNRYRVWSNGFIEQWGLLNGPDDAGGTVTFPKNFSNTDYIFVVTPNEAKASGSLFTWYTWNKTISSITSILRAANNSAPKQSWYAAGF